MKTLEEHRHDAAVESHLSRIADALERLAAAIESAPNPVPPEAYVPGPRIALAASDNPADNPQPTPWRLGALGVPEIYDAAGDLVTAVGNDFSSMAGDMANARRIVEAVNEKAAREAKRE